MGQRLIYYQISALGQKTLAALVFHPAAPLPETVSRALQRRHGEDITGIVAPALLITIVSGVVAVVAAVRQKRAGPNLSAR